MKAARKKFSHINTNEMKKRKLKAEFKQSVKLAVLISMLNITSKFKNLSTTSILFKVGFMVLYSPCAFLCLYKVFISKHAGNRDLETMLNALAKTSVVWFSLVCLFCEKELKEKLYKFITCDLTAPVDPTIDLTAPR